jgi:hypothetical protein
MSFRSHRLGGALGYAVLLWIIGFIWGLVVFIVPSLKAVPSIAYVSKYPAISFVLLPVYFVLLYFLARRYLRSTKEKAIEGLKLGIVIFLVTIVLDALVYVALLGGGDYFAFLSIWVSYAMFVLVPWLVGLKIEGGLLPTSGDTVNSCYPQSGRVYNTQEMVYITPGPRAGYATRTLQRTLNVRRIESSVT